MMRKKRVRVRASRGTLTCLYVDRRLVLLSQLHLPLALPLQQKLSFCGCDRLLDELDFSSRGRLL